MSDMRDKISEYLLDELSDAERIEFETAVAADPALAEEVSALGDVVTRLDALPDEAWEPISPPPLRLGRSEPEPAPSSKSEPAKTQKRGLLSWLSEGFSVKPALAFAAVALFFAAGVGVGVIADSTDDSAPPLAQTIQQAKLAPVSEVDAAATGVADVKKDGQVIRLNLSGLAPTPEDKFYEAWLMDPKNGLVAIGTFRVADDGEATLDLPIPVGTDKFPIVDISLQEVNGKPEHSGVSVLRGELN